MAQRTWRMATLEGERERMTALACALGAVIRQERKAKGIKAIVLALDCAVTTQAVSFWECGRRIPEWPIMLRIAAALGTTASELIRRAEEMLAGAPAEPSAMAA